MSHIIPDFGYRLLTAKTHPKMVVVRNASADPVDLKRQTGFKERLLCDDCESQFSRYEAYASQKLFRLFHRKQPSSFSRGAITLTGLDYRRLKLFFLSVLWRGSVATDPFFKLVDLGAHENAVQGMITREDPGATNEYGCSVLYLRPEGGMDFSRTVFQPAAIDLEGQAGVLFSFRGFVFTFVHSADGSSSPLSKSFLSTSGKLSVIIVSLQDVGPLYDLFRRTVETAQKS